MGIQPPQMNTPERGDSLRWSRAQNWTTQTMEKLPGLSTSFLVFVSRTSSLFFFSLVNSCLSLPDFPAPGWFIQKLPCREDVFIFKWVLWFKLFHPRIERPASDMFSRLLQCQCARRAMKEKPTNSPFPPSAWALTAWSGNDLAGNLVLSFPAWASLSLSKMRRKHIVISRYWWLPKKKQTPLGSTF